MLEGGQVRGSRRLNGPALPGAFDTAAARYDALVGANPGYHTALRAAAAQLRLPEGGAGATLLDLGCGTGASTAALLTVAPAARIVAVDASAGMLARARTKPWPDTVRFVHAKAETVTEAVRDAGVDGPLDGVFAAYLVRNLAEPDRDGLLADVHALLRPGAPLVVQDYSVRGRPLAGLVWTSVCWVMIIPAGAVTTGDHRLFTYLWRSARAFDGAGQFRDRLHRAGFVEVTSTTSGGWQRGILHTFTGRRPPE
jgi:ubiquinone/menaquinone biosynthesis C-methylase UbiE